MPSTEAFDAQDAAYRESVLPRAVTKRVAVEAAPPRRGGSTWASKATSSASTASALRARRRICFRISASRPIMSPKHIERIPRGKRSENDMAIKVGINGYGRIGRNILRALFEAKRTDEIEIVAINDLGDAKTNAHLTRYDTAHGKFPGEVEGRWRLDGRQRPAASRCSPSATRRSCRGAMSAWIFVLECTGPLHQQGEGRPAPARVARRSVIISAPGGEDVDATIVYGVNHNVLKKDMTVISNASCTTNCSRAGGEGAERQDRHPVGRDDDDPCVHERSGADGRVSLRPASRPLGDDVADPDQDRRRRGRGPGAAGAEGPAGWLRRARADDQRLAGGPELHREARHERGRDQQGAEGSVDRRAEGRAGVQRRPAGLGGFQP